MTPFSELIICSIHALDCHMHDTNNLKIYYAREKALKASLNYVDKRHCVLWF